MSKRAKETKPIDLVPFTYWLTRDCDIDGTLEDTVDVWMARPCFERIASEGGVCWFDDSPTGMTHRWKRLPLAIVAAWGHTIPETPHECIRVETVGRPV